MKPGRMVMLVIGTLLAMLGLSLVIAAGTLGSAWARQQQDGYLTVPVERYAVNSYALTTMRADIAAETLPLPARMDQLVSLVLRGQNADPAKPVFLGVARQADVDRYLAGTARSVLDHVQFDPFQARYREIAGSRAPEPPGQQTFWASSSTGTGRHELPLNLRPGNWVVVVMNADASRPLLVDLQAGARSELLGPLALGLLTGGLAMLVVGVPLLLAGAAGLGRLIPAGTGPAAATAPYPARLSGTLDPELSRGLWLVKWLLAVPHYIVLAILWFAFVVATIASGVAILFTGRYPRNLFNFNVGVLRWQWRVAFYAFAALGTDRYPPFTLARTDYPADFDVDYPQRLNNWLVLVKPWLLAVPHLLIVSVLTGSAGLWWARGNGGNWGAGIGLLGLLVFIAGVVLLFTGRYRPDLFALVMGLNRWIYRVYAYVGLMRDEYPPFRLDQGPADPGAAGAGPGTGTGSAAYGQPPSTPR
ncbi:DUF4389 domain-containing protein [Arthrobacter sp. GCM10027362]|uniref:DUF4389 domain-containing protein n=1 Tax=Arthrobacter sp. GCM10027362 TaxID=3273379 RepID=UPI003627A420